MAAQGGGRVAKELKKVWKKKMKKDLHKDEEGLEMFSPPEPDDNDTTVWKMFVYGPSKIMYKEEIKESPYKGASFLIQMKLMDYPQKAPKVSFVTRIFHPLVKADDGSFCQDSLWGSEGWKPALTTWTIAERVHELLVQPNFEEGDGNPAATIQDGNFDAWYAKALQETKTHAMDD